MDQEREYTEPVGEIPYYRCGLRRKGGGPIEVELMHYPTFRKRTILWTIEKDGDRYRCGLFSGDSPRAAAKAAWEDWAKREIGRRERLRLAQLVRKHEATPCTEMEEARRVRARAQRGGPQEPGPSS